MRGNLNVLRCDQHSWESKQLTARGISNQHIENIYPGVRSRRALGQESFGRRRRRRDDVLRRPGAPHGRSGPSRKVKALFTCHFTKHGAEDETSLRVTNSATSGFARIGRQPLHDELIGDGGRARQPAFLARAARSCLPATAAAQPMRSARRVGQAICGDRPALASVALTTGCRDHRHCNDFGFERIFSRQIEAIARSGDLLIAMSTSGHSPERDRSPGDSPLPRRRHGGTHGQRGPWPSGATTSS